MNQPQVYMCSPSWTLLPPPSPYHPSGLSQCTSPKHPVSCIEPGLATRFIHDIMHVSMPFSQIFPPSPSATESIRLYVFHLQNYSEIFFFAFHKSAYKLLLTYFQRKKSVVIVSRVWLFKHSPLKNMNSFLRHTFKYRKIKKHSFLGVMSMLLQITKLSFYSKCYHLKNSKNVNGPESLLSVSWMVQLGVFSSHCPADKIWDYTGIRWGFQ